MNHLKHVLMVQIPDGYRHMVPVQHPKTVFNFFFFFVNIDTLAGLVGGGGREEGDRVST